MRTTLNLDDEVLRLLKDYASDRCIALGEAASELVRKGLETPVRLRLDQGFYAVYIPPGGHKVSSSSVKELLEEEN